MRHLSSKILFFVFTFVLLTISTSFSQSSDKWIPLFDGESLDGWKASEHPGTFSVEDGKIVTDGPRAHLFYVGSVENHNFKDFEFKADVMTTEGSNSGIYFHTEYQDTGWPSKGYEAQVNNTYEGDPRRTASLYGIDDITDPPATDGQWFTMYIKVEGKDITIKVDGKTMVQYTEPENVDREGRVLDQGTFALQGHDPQSKVYYKNILVRPLPE